MLADQNQSDPSDSSSPGVRVGVYLFIPADRAGLVIGTGGKNIREVERFTNTSIKVEGGNTLDYMEEETGGFEC